MSRVCIPTDSVLMTISLLPRVLIVAAITAVPLLALANPAQAATVDKSTFTTEYKNAVSQWEKKLHVSGDSVQVNLDSDTITATIIYNQDGSTIGWGNNNSAKKSFVRCTSRLVCYTKEPGKPWVKENKKESQTSNTFPEAVEVLEGIDSESTFSITGDTYTVHYSNGASISATFKPNSVEWTVGADSSEETTTITYTEVEPVTVTAPKPGGAAGRP